VKAQDIIETAITMSADDAPSAIMAKSIVRALLEGGYRIKEVKDSRSLRQNNFFHGPLVESFVQHTGDTDREFLKWRLKVKFLTINKGHKRERVKNTSELSTKEMSDFIDQCIWFLCDENDGLGGALTVEAGADYQALKVIK
jgi:hypothetical protein